MPIEGIVVAAGLGELQKSRDPRVVLVAYGLGSCIGVVAYEPAAQVGALLHAVLPHASGPGSGPPTRFVDTGIEALLREIERSGGQPCRLVVKMVGGARMLIRPGLKDVFDIGARNVETARRVLAEHGLSLAAVDVGGSQGRTVRLFVATGRVLVKIVGEEREL